MARLVMLDRDGVLNEDSPDHVRSVAEFRWLDGAREAVARLAHAGRIVCVATNQSGIARGLFDHAALFAIFDRMQRDLSEYGARLDAIAYAPDHPERAGPMRKPAPGMLLELMRRLGVDPSDAVFVGDSLRDIEAARAAGCRPVLVRTGNGARVAKEHREQLQDVAIFDDLAAFAAAELQQVGSLRA